MATRRRQAAVPADRIAAVRGFNRFHTRFVGALGERLLASDYSLAQLRVLYEIACAPADAPASASRLCRDLGVDPGYLSRLITGLESERLVARHPAPDNAKRLALTLTAQGRALCRRLDAASARQVAGLLRGLSEREQAQLVGCMEQVQRLLGRDAADAGFILRPPRAGDLGLIVHGQAVLYATEYGWDWTFEALVAQLVARFVQEFDPAHACCWVAERAGQVVGSAFVVREDDETAKLRMVYVDAAARGLGIGRRLVDECIAFARSRGYRRMVLWTNDVLVAARRIYEAAGFALQEEAPHRSFGKDLIGQTWSRAL